MSAAVLRTLVLSLALVLIVCGVSTPTVGPPCCLWSSSLLRAFLLLAAPAVAASALLLPVCLVPPPLRNTDSKAVVDLRRFDAPVELQVLALRLPPPEGALLPLSLAVAADGMLPLFSICRRR